MSSGDLIVQAECGYTWYMDYEPAPDNCADEYWRLGIENENGTIDWASWTDREGNSVDK